jgi:hypothetical protein
MCQNIRIAQLLDVMVLWVSDKETLAIIAAVDGGSNSARSGRMSWIWACWAKIWARSARPGMWNLILALVCHADDDLQPSAGLPYPLPPLLHEDDWRRRGPRIVLIKVAICDSSCVKMVTYLSLVFIDTASVMCSGRLCWRSILGARYLEIAGSV